MGENNDKTIALLTLGCKLNYAETGTYARGFTEAGFRIVPWSHGADVYVVNTCSVTGVSDAKSRNLVRKVHRVNPSAIIIVTGCSAQLRRSDYESLPGVARVFGSSEKHLVVPETLSLLGDYDAAPGEGLRGVSSGKTVATLGSSPKGKMSPGGLQGEKSSLQGRRGPQEDDGEDESLLSDEQRIPVGGVAQRRFSGGHSPETVFAAWSSGERTRSFLKVQDGCNNYCKYCTVPYARGESRNVPIAECVENARKIAERGVKEIVLTGVNTGDFGKTTGESFLDLLKALNEVEGIERYRISSIEPNLLTEEIVDWIAGGTKFQPHFHIPLQTGSDTLLARMGRHYDTEFFACKLEYVRKAMEGPGKPLVFFGIDVMVGLPGETDELFAQTVEFLQRVRPSFIHVFPYSRRPGTPAAEMDGQVPESVKKERVATLEALCEQLHSEFVQANRGIRERVLFESTDRQGFMEGYTGNYIRIRRPFDAALCGKIVDVTI